MKNRKQLKTITILCSLSVFVIGGYAALHSAGAGNSIEQSSITTVLAQGNVQIIQTEAVTQRESETQSETEIQTEAEHFTEIATESTTAEARYEEPITSEVKTEPVTLTTEPETQAATEPTTAVTVKVDLVVSEVINLMNTQRTIPVLYDATLTEMAQTRASENANNDFFVVENGKHMRPDNRTASSIALDYGQYGHFGEVMGRYQRTPQEIVNGWINSSTHYNCMVNTIYTRVGVGYAADSKGNLYWVAIFMD